MAIYKSGAVVRRCVNNQTQILMLHNLEHNYWLLPKGHIEEGESKEEAAIREIKEETGLTVKIIQFIDSVKYDDSDNNKVALDFYMAERVEGEIQPEQNHELMWMTVEEAVNAISYDDLKEFLVRHRSIIER